MRAYEESQRYKEGNYIIEKQRVMKVCSHILDIFNKPADWNVQEQGCLPDMRWWLAAGGLVTPAGT